MALIKPKGVSGRRERRDQRWKEERKKKVKYVNDINYKGGAKK